MSRRSRVRVDRLERLDNAACAEHPQPDLWFSANPASRAAARAICAGCPARQTCLIGALRRGEQYGTWGGHDLDRVAEHPANGWATAAAGGAA